MALTSGRVSSVFNSLLSMLTRMPLKADCILLSTAPPLALMVSAT